MKLALALSVILASSAPARAAPDFAGAVKADYDAHLRALFIDIHQHPELSFQEARTAKLVAKELRATGAEVTEGVGGNGVVAVMRNGPGPTVLYRAEMDALPIKEASGLPFASHVTATERDGTIVPVAHACGHDINLVALIGTARRMAAMKDRWQGTIVFVGQPAEERSGGARAMIADGLYTRFPKPDFALTAHVDADFTTGTIYGDPGIQGSSTDSVTLTIRGVGAHGADPHLAKDPVVMGAETVMALQTLISRSKAPMVPGVVTVGAFRSGTKHNIIPETAELQLSVRADDEQTRQMLLRGIKRVADSVARMNGVGDEMLPRMEVVESAPVVVNDPPLTARLHRALTSAFGNQALVSVPRTGMGSDDFAYYIEPQHHVPGFYILVGGTPPEAERAAAAGGKPIPSPHTPEFVVADEPSIIFGVEAMTIELFDLLKR